MSARGRDVIGVAILVAAGIAVRLSWRPLGPWAALVIAFAAILAVVLVYRLHTAARSAQEPEQGVDQEPALLLRRR